MRGTLSVPERYREALHEIGSLPSDAVDDLVKSIASAADSERGLQEAFAKHLKSPAAFDAALSAAVLRSSHGMRAGAAALEIAGGLEEPVSADALAKILEAPKLVLLAKTIDLSGAGQKVLHTSRIVTDVRPMFDDAPSPKSMGSLVVHSLVLTTFSAAGPEEIFVSLDDEDLDTLREQVTRALEKGKHVREALAGSSLKVVEEVGADVERR